MKEKSVNISYSLFLNIIRLIYGTDWNETDGSTVSLVKVIDEQLLAKIEAMKRREAYTKSKIAATPEEKEAARQEYLDMIGMRSSFRW